MAEVLGSSDYAATASRRALHSSYVVASPIVIIDMRDMYLKNILLIGITTWDEPAFPNLIRYIEAGELRPFLAATWPPPAQDAFTKNDFVGNFVLIPPEAGKHPVAQNVTSP